MGILFFARFEGQKPWQHLRAMHDFGSLDAKRGPSRQDTYAMYPKPPDCTWKWTHRARILPFRSRKAYISGKHCQGEALLHAFVEKRTHTVRFLPGDAVKQPQREGWMRASWGGAAGVAGAGRAVAVGDGRCEGGCCCGRQRAGDGVAEGGARAVARGAGGEHSPPWSIGDSSLAQIRWSLRGRRLQ